MSDPAVPDFVHADLDALGMAIDAEALAKLADYLARLLEANRQMNLTAVREPDAAWRRLIIDSLTPLPWMENLPPQATVIDIGTGGGLPGVPLAITRPDLRFTLLDATGKKVRFLEGCIEALGLSGSVRAIQDRAETLGHRGPHREHYDLAISRAIGHMSEVLEYSLPLVRVGGRVLAMKGPRAEQELEEAGDALSILGGGELEVFDAYPESFDNDLVIISVTKDRPTPKGYPRAPGTPKGSRL
jgi:16S rRNA (guanine527-N7)-methyltransferase